MNKSELVSAVIKAQQQKGRTIAKGDAESIVNSVFETIRDEVKTGGKVTLTGFATFSRKTKAKRNGTHPRTGQPLEIAAKEVVHFSPSSTFLD